MWAMCGDNAGYTEHGAATACRIYTGAKVWTVDVQIARGIDGPFVADLYNYKRRVISI